MFGTGISDTNADDAAAYQQIKQRLPDFGLVLPEKIIRGFNSIGNDGSELMQSFESDMSTGISSVLAAIQTNDIVNIMNVAATIGDVSLTTAPGWDISGPVPFVGQWNVDRLPDGPATRVSKSRSQTGLTSNALSLEGKFCSSTLHDTKKCYCGIHANGNIGIWPESAKGPYGINS